MSDKSGKKELSARDFICGLAAVLPMDELAAVIAVAKKGMDIRYKNRMSASWKPAELKKLRGRLIFSQWSWFGHGLMFRQSWDGTVSQDVSFFYPDGQTRLEGSLKSQVAYKMLEKLARRAVANCDGEAEVEVVLSTAQVRTFFAEEGGAR